MSGEFLVWASTAFWPPLLWTFYFFLPIVLPLTLASIFLSLWLRYLRTNRIAQQDYVLLEIKVPRKVGKSPLAMEVFLTALYQKGALTYFDTYWEGKTKPWFSLELVSLGGEVKFFIWSERRWQRTIESQLYAQYPDLEIFEAEDYARSVKADPEQLNVWGTYFLLSNKDAYPIKTYIDYGLEKEAKEQETQVDPLSVVIEYLGSLKEGEQAWIQILIQAHKKEGWREGRFWRKPDWKKEARKEIERIYQSLKLDEAHMRIPSEGEKLKMTAIERSLDKFPFEAAIRAFYLAKPENFEQVGITGLIGSVRQYNSLELNGLKLGWYTDHSDNEKDWIQLFSFLPGLKKAMSRRRQRMEREMLAAYKMRSFFQPPYRHFHALPFILTTEEIATLFHIPSQATATPTLPRIPSKKSAAPADLPV